MVHINKNLGNLNLNGLSNSKGAKEVKKEEDVDFKPQTEIDELVIFRQTKNGKFKKVYDDGDWSRVIFQDKLGQTIILDHD